MELHIQYMAEPRPKARSAGSEAELSHRPESEGRVQLPASASPGDTEQAWQVIPLKPATDPPTHWLIQAVFVPAHW